VREYCMRECETFLKGVIESIDIPVINNPIFEVAAAQKPLQLKIAQKVGLPIPKTIMSNDPQEIIEFWKKMDGRCIYKAFRSPSWQLVETRMLTEEDLKHLDKLRHAPIIVQEKIEKGSDIRVNIFGERIFAAAVNTSILAAELDWRLDLTATWKEHLLPDDVGQKLICLLRRLGLHYGCFDLRQQPDGTYVFLEVNPSGQFIFMELYTGQPITRSFAELLLHPEISMTYRYH
jgi:glutathione synthase/RimK-type ligase-like ATP-grasp enzyme